MNITIVGAGNIGTQFAVHCAEKGHSVTVYTSKPGKIAKELYIVNEYGKEIHCGTIKCATNDAAAAFESADLVFVTVPAFCMQDIADKIIPYSHSGMKIGLIPGSGGGECAFIKCLDNGATIFGIQRVPSVARLVEYGKCVKATGYRELLYAAALPNKETNVCSEIVGTLFDKSCIPLPNYLNLTLTPSNPLIHTTRLKTLFNDYYEGKTYDRVPLFYEEWDNAASELLLKCDDEVQNICNNIKQFDLSYIRSLRVHYESPTAEALTKKISGIPGFKGIAAPMLEVDGGYIPDLNSRYFTADFSYGLSILVQIAQFFNLDTPYMKNTLNWYCKIAVKKEEFRFENYGIKTIEDFLKFYER